MNGHCPVDADSGLSCGSAAAVLAGAGLASAASVCVELGGKNLDFGRVGHCSSPLCP
jgi:hypothetical protein